MIGILNTTCIHKKLLSKDKYNTPIYDNPSTIPCAIQIEPKLQQTDVGLVKINEKFYVLHTDAVSTGDLLDDLEVVVEPIRALSGEIIWYKAVVLNA